MKKQVAQNFLLCYIFTVTNATQPERFAETNVLRFSARVRSADDVVVFHRLARISAAIGLIHTRINASIRRGWQP